MGVFDESICDCCVCPMQCVLEQLIGKEVGINVSSSGVELFVIIQIEEVKNFIVSGTDENGVRINFPICKIVSVTPPSEAFPLNLKPIQKSTKGECVCCEDPITDLANSLSGRKVTIFPFPEDIVTICEVGEGIVIVQSQEDMIKMVLSSCFILSIVEGAIFEGLEILQASNYLKKSINKNE
ncbi:hypothetical protein [Chengkuizengella sediminis]|uniref:hypothetical protein n=1 Tax=Chengkuizengella sediminis TaxID=1885917 RepID=UPI001389E23C|nr:hypothetical protein [Chengkuizengella sediminis]